MDTKAEETCTRFVDVRMSASGRPKKTSVKVRMLCLPYCETRKFVTHLTFCCTLRAGLNWREVLAMDTKAEE
eukprot:3017298-Pleurochrysis_carterae.AAC.1